MRVKVKVTGIVQGVGFRPFIYWAAVKNGLNGYVKNRGDAGVEILLEGEERRVRSFLTDVKMKKPPLAEIHGMVTSRLEGRNEYQTFFVDKSSNETELSGSVIPPDIAICDKCLEELRSPEDPRYDYFFTTCTNCGPRFTTIKKLPYDRKNTTMREFPMCNFCLKEFGDPLNRRFHAQTVACPECGPKAYLTTADGRQVKERDPVRKAGRLLSEGKILVIKGYGGFHIACSTVRNQPLARLREVKHRSQKPFAVMVRSLDAIRTFAEISRKEEELLASHRRPIVLLNKKKEYSLSELIAPGLHNIGVMLPYTGLHYMLFDKAKDAAFVMTSANPPDQPITKDNDEALETLSNTADYFLFHNRKIAYRCDDSVLRTHGKRNVFIRRSRGYAPAPIILEQTSRECVLALGGELNNTACILNGNKAFMTQHIGDVENVETREFLRTSIEHLIRLTNSRVDTVACDLHPKFTTTALARQLAEENKWKFVQVQHHHAHVAGLMAEHNVEEMIGICCDGYGYGLDGEAWGGEILLCRKDTPGFERLAHLEKQPLAGGDLATRYPLRMAAGILYGKTDVEEWLLQHRQHFPHGKTEFEAVLQQLLSRRGIIKTTSCGRVLDSVSAVLGICYERTYEGEPSVKLESAAMGGKDRLALEPLVKGNVLNTTCLLQRIFEGRKKHSQADLAYSAQAYLARGLAALAVEKAQEHRVRTIGFSGGVACNEEIAAIIRKAVESTRNSFLVNEVIPAGDGGVSFGQATASVPLRL